jgi:hypothetical protein
MIFYRNKFKVNKIFLKGLKQRNLKLLKKFRNKAKKINHIIIKINEIKFNNNWKI